MSTSNILILSGGIKETRSLRNIFLQRNGAFVDTLDIPEEAKADMRALTPHNYIGNAIEQAKAI